MASLKIFSGNCMFRGSAASTDACYVLESFCVIGDPTFLSSMLGLQHLAAFGDGCLLLSILSILSLASFIVTAKGIALSLMAPIRQKLQATIAVEGLGAGYG